MRSPPTSGSSSRRDGLPLRGSAVPRLTTCSIFPEEMLCIHAHRSLSPVSPSAIKCNAPHNVYTTQLVVIFDQHEKQFFLPTTDTKEAYHLYLCTLFLSFCVSYTVLFPA